MKWLTDRVSADLALVIEAVCDKAMGERCALLLEEIDDALNSIADYAEQ